MHILIDIVSLSIFMGSGFNVARFSEESIPIPCKYLSQYFTLYFASGSASLDPVHEELIGQTTASTYSHSERCPVQFVTVVGHADTFAPTDDSQKLSIERAVTVRDALIAHTIPADKISIVGAGRARFRETYRRWRS